MNSRLTPDQAHEVDLMLEQMKRKRDHNHTLVGRRVEVDPKAPKTCYGGYKGVVVKVDNRERLFFLQIGKRLYNWVPQWWCSVVKQEARKNDS